MRWNRRNTKDNQQPTTSYASAETENRVPHRRQKVHSPHPVISEFTASDELFFVRANQDQPNINNSPRLYAGGSPSGHGHTTQHQRSGASSASVIVFAFALSGILLVFLLFYFLAKVCSPSTEEDLKDQQSESMANGLNMKRGATPRKMASGVQETPKHVLYPRRIYELQAEEGCYSSLPSMKTPETLGGDVVVLKKSSPSSKKRNFKQLVRKLTTSSVPLSLSEGAYEPDDSTCNSPRFSTCSEA